MSYIPVRRCSMPGCGQVMTSRHVPAGSPGTVALDVYKCRICDVRQCEPKIGGCGNYVQDGTARNCPSCGKDLVKG